MAEIVLLLVATHFLYPCLVAIADDKGLSFGIAIYWHFFSSRTREIYSPATHKKLSSSDFPYMTFGENIHEAN